MDDIYSNYNKRGSSAQKRASQVTGEIPPLPREVVYPRANGDIPISRGNTSRRTAPPAQTRGGTRAPQTGTRAGTSGTRQSFAQRSGTAASRTSAAQRQPGTAQRQTGTASGASRSRQTTAGGTRQSAAQRGTANTQRTSQARGTGNGQSNRNARSNGTVRSTSTAKRRKRRSPVKRFFRGVFTLLFIAVLVFCGAFAYGYRVISESGYHQTDLRDNPYIAPSALRSDPKVQNILLLGVDEGDSTNTRADTMLLLSIDRRNHAIKLTSFLRDTWVDIPGVGTAKLNAACSNGGAQLVKDTLETVYHVKIDDYILVNFEIFTHIIDAIGGIKVEITEKEADFINRTTRHTVSAGDAVKLNGAEALVYCRIRKLDSDFMRTFRQRKVMNAIFTKLKHTNPIKLVRVAKEVVAELETSLAPLSLDLLAFSGVIKLLSYETYSLQVPARDTWKSGTKRGQSVILADIDANCEILSRFIYQNDLSYSDEKGI